MGRIVLSTTNNDAPVQILRHFLLYFGHAAPSCKTRAKPQFRQFQSIRGRMSSGLPPPLSDPAVATRMVAEKGGHSPFATSSVSCAENRQPLAARRKARVAVAEGYFATLETELMALLTLTTRSRTSELVEDYIETYFNTQRRHSHIGLLDTSALRVNILSSQPVHRTWAIPLPNFIRSCLGFKITWTTGTFLGVSNRKVESRT